MEKAAGVPLFQVWGSMSEFEKLQLIKNLTRIESQLANIAFPAYGGLYLRTDISQSNRPLDGDIDPARSFCIGPSCYRAFGTDLMPELNRGPWDSISDLGVSIAPRELSRLSKDGQEIQPNYYKGTIDQQSQLLEFTISLMKLLDSNELLRQACQPTLWHTDLHMGNIYVNPDERSQIVSLIDFQSTSVLPAFLQAQWPVFLRPPRNYDYVNGIFHPKLPDDFDTLNEESKQLALREWNQVKLAKAYEVSTYLENRTAHNAMNVPRVIRELFIRCGEVSEVSLVPLRACLIEISRTGTSLGFSGTLPFSFSQVEIDEHERQFAEYQAWHEVRALAEECLDTDAEGGIAPQLDVNEKRRQNEELLALYIQKVAGDKYENEARAMWPFSTETRMRSGNP